METDSDSDSSVDPDDAFNPDEFFDPYDAFDPDEFFGVVPEGGWVHLTAADLEHFGDTIHANAFHSLCDLRSVVFPPTVLYIHAEAFYKCVNLATVTFPPQLKWIGNHAFCGCSTVEALSLPGSVVEIGAGAFSNCINLATFTIPPLLKTTIKGFPRRGSLCCDDVFAGCVLLSEATREGWNPTGFFQADDLAHFGNSMGAIPDNTFIHRDDVQYVVIPHCVRIIGTRAFMGCRGLKGVVPSPNITSIEPHAFHGCRHLKTFIIPESVREIGGGAFAGCWHLAKVVAAVAPTVEPIIVGEDVFRSNFVPWTKAMQLGMKCMSAPKEVAEAYTASASIANLSAAVTAEHDKLQLLHYYWSIKTHNYPFTTTTQKAYVKVLLLISNRSAAMAVEQQAYDPTDQQVMLPEMPSEMWIYVLGMMRRTDLGAGAAKTSTAMLHHLDTGTVGSIAPSQVQWTGAPSAVDQSGDQAFRQQFTDAGGSTPWYIALDIALVVAASAVALGWVLAGASG